MRKLFVSYARENKPDVDQLVEHLGTMGYDTWVDAALRGGQDWWNEILDRIADTDVVIAIYSSAAVNSTACGREFEWAEALGKPIVPVAVEPPPSAIPSRFARRQIIDYSDPAERPLAALKLQGALATLPPAPPLPDPLPEPPRAPLSYLTDLIDRIIQPGALDHDQQHQILRELEPALTSFDPPERRGGRDILERLSARRDLYADVDRVIARLRQLPSQLVQVDNDQGSKEAMSATTVVDPATATDVGTGTTQMVAGPPGIQPEAAWVDQPKRREEDSGVGNVPTRLSTVSASKPGRDRENLSGGVPKKRLSGQLVAFAMISVSLVAIIVLIAKPLEYGYGARPKLLAPCLLAGIFAVLMLRFLRIGAFGLFASCGVGVVLGFVGFTKEKGAADYAHQLWPGDTTGWHAKVIADDNLAATLCLGISALFLVIGLLGAYLFIELSKRDTAAAD